MARSKKIYRARQERIEATRLNAYVSNPTYTFHCPVHGAFEKPYDSSKAICPSCIRTVQVCDRVER